MRVYVCVSICILCEYMRALQGLWGSPNGRMYLSDHAQGFGALPCEWDRVRGALSLSVFSAEFRVRVYTKNQQKNQQKSNKKATKKQQNTKNEQKQPQKQQQQ